MEKEAIILIVLLITIIMFSVNKILNIVMGSKTVALKELMEKIKNLQERMKNAQLLNDPRLIYQLQIEGTQLMKNMMKKQLVPMCSRCFVFIGVFIILDNFVFFDYRSGLLPFPILFFGSGWAALYFLFAIGLSLLLYAIKRLYRKLTGKPNKRSSILQQLMSGNLESSEDSSGIKDVIVDDFVEGDEVLDSWKGRIQRDGAE